MVRPFDTPITGILLTAWYARRWWIHVSVHRNPIRGVEAVVLPLSCLARDRIFEYHPPHRRLPL